MYLPLSPMYAIDVVNTQQNTNKKECVNSWVLINLLIVILDNLKIMVIKPIRKVSAGDSKCKEITKHNASALKNYHSAIKKKATLIKKHSA